MSWSCWLDERHRIHVVENVDVHPMQLGEQPSPWHSFDDAPCQCQPKVIERDVVTGRPTVGHKDPIQ